jgi:transcription antitermination factor NusG
MIDIKNWYVVYTRSRCEKKVNSFLTKRGVESYCPLNRCHKKWADRNKIVLEPLFNSYVFIKVNKKEIVSVKQMTSDIVNVVYWLGAPAVIREEEIKHIQLFLGEYQNVKIEKREVRVNDEIKIIQGPLMNTVGKIGEVRKNIVKVLIPSLGYMLTAEVKISNIEIIDMNIIKSEQELLVEMQ